jgi:hypothetical protein
VVMVVVEQKKLKNSVLFLMMLRMGYWVLWRKFLVVRVMKKVCEECVCV